MISTSVANSEHTEVQSASTQTQPQTQQSMIASTSVNSSITPKSSSRTRNYYAKTRTSIPRMSPHFHRSCCYYKTPDRINKYSSRRRCCATSITTSGMDDRFIPSRRRMNIELCRRTLLSENHGFQGSTPKNNTPRDDTAVTKEYKRRMRSALCNISLDELDDDGEPTGSLLSFGSDKKKKREPTSVSSSSVPNTENPYAHDTIRTAALQQHEIGPYPVAFKTKHTTKRPREVGNSSPRCSYDATGIYDNFCLNNISWGKDNILAIGIDKSVHLWNAITEDVQEFVVLEATTDDYIASVSWCTFPGCSKYIAVGTKKKKVHIIDAQALCEIRTLEGHSDRVCSLAWNNNQRWLTSGSDDSKILQHDICCRENIVSKYMCHEDEVCGLKWNEDGSVLASGGTDNLLCLWDAAMSNHASSRCHGRRSNTFSPRLVFTEHKCTIKALDWCSSRRGLLASGGGMYDGTIKFWNSNSGAMLDSVNTGSPVSSVLWSKHTDELCSSHGYDKNHLILWQYPTMKKTKEFNAHNSGILNMEMSPDGGRVVSAGANEILHIWKIFDDTPTQTSHYVDPNMILGGQISFGGPRIR